MARKSQKANPNISFPSIRSNASNVSTNSIPTTLDFRSRLIHQIIPALFFAALLIAGTIVCMYSLFLVQVVPAHALLGCIITMAILFAAEVILCLCIRSDHKTIGTSDAESQHGTQPNRQSWTSFTKRPREHQPIQSPGKDESAIITGRGSFIISEDFNLPSERTPKANRPEQPNNRKEAYDDYRKKATLPKRNRWAQESASNAVKVRAVQSDDRLLVNSYASQPSLALASDILEVTNVAVPEYSEESSKVDVHPRRGSCPLLDSKLNLAYNTIPERAGINRKGEGTLPKIRPLSIRKVNRNIMERSDCNIGDAIRHDKSARINEETGNIQRSEQAPEFNPDKSQ